MVNEQSESVPGIGSLLDILSHASAVVQANIVAARLRDQPPDFCIAPQVGDVGLFDLNRAADTIESGRAAARAILPDLLAAIHRVQRRERSPVQVFSRRMPIQVAA